MDFEANKPICVYENIQIMTRLVACFYHYPGTNNDILNTLREGRYLIQKP
jgi:hypothetical protein